jgi:hypothetical protein
MKNLKIILVGLVLAVMMGCQKDNPVPNENNIEEKLDCFCGESLYIVDDFRVDGYLFTKQMVKNYCTGNTRILTVSGWPAKGTKICDNTEW